MERWFNDIGIPAKADLIGFNNMVGQLISPTSAAGLDMWILGWMDSFFHTRFGEAGSGALNFVGYSNPEFDVLATQLQEETDLVKAQLLVRDMQSFLAEDLPHITLFSTMISDVFRSSRVKFPYTNILDGIQLSNGLQCRVLIQ